MGKHLVRVYLNFFHWRLLSSLLYTCCTYVCTVSLAWMSHNFLVMLSHFWHFVCLRKIQEINSKTPNWTNTPSNWSYFVNNNTIVVSPADKCICLLSDLMHISGIKNKGMQAKCYGMTFLTCNNYVTYITVLCPSPSGLEGGPAKGAVQQDLCAPQYPHGPGPWHGLGGTVLGCLQL
jgi:hypothetical protein